MHWKDWCWRSNTLATWCEKLTLWKRPCSGKDRGEEEKGATEDEMDGWHHWLNGQKFEQTQGDRGQETLACCSSWGCKESDMTEQLNWIELLKVNLSDLFLSARVFYFHDFHIFSPYNCKKLGTPILLREFLLTSNSFTMQSFRKNLLINNLSGEYHGLGKIKLVYFLNTN